MRTWTICRETGKTPVVIRNPLVIQYSGTDFRERIGEEWPQEELGLFSSGMIGPRGRDITAAGLGAVKSCRHKWLGQGGRLCSSSRRNSGPGGHEAGTCLVPYKHL